MKYGVVPEKGLDSEYKQRSRPGADAASGHQPRMAIARPVRALGLAAVVMWCFFLWQIFTPSTPATPRTQSHQNFERDPNLDRKYHHQRRGRNDPSCKRAC